MDLVYESLVGAGESFYLGCVLSDLLLVFLVLLALLADLFNGDGHLT